MALLGLAHDAQGQLVLPLGQYHRGRVLVRAVAEGHREVGGVSDDHIGLRYLLHHPGLGHLPLCLLDLALDLGIALHLLEFLFDLLLGHADLPLVLPPLVKDVRPCQHGKGQSNLHGQQKALLKQVGAGGQQVGMEIAGELVHHTGDIAVDQKQKNRDF